MSGSLRPEKPARFGFGTKKEFGENLGAGETAIVYYWLAAASSHEEVCISEKKIADLGVEKILDQTRNASKEFLAPIRKDFDGLTQETIADLYKRSLLTMATLAGKNGSTAAAADSDNRNGYVWGRDGAMKASAISRAGFPLAHSLAKSGRKVSLIESEKVGGSCVNFGCTPTKASIASAREKILTFNTIKIYDNGK